ncbi:2-amino-4-hydroxy-6-hydroxymethyldihydropteridine diphosphokinase [Mycolicibacterium sp. 3033]|nr:2-amino-4-hydroxy-6-hydroxymethyldihydropteridine diphosphokinase [Mycolicibacterium aurantiacum]
MTSVVLSIGSNLGDRVAQLQSVLDGLGDTVTAVSPVYETAAWGGVEQGAFLNAVVLADDASRTAHQWLHRAHELEAAARRVRQEHWGPRTLDVDLVEARDGGRELAVDDEVLTLPHPYAHVRAFVLVPWLDVAPEATLTVEDRPTLVSALLAALDPAERAGVYRTDHVLTPRTAR